MYGGLAGGLEGVRWLCFGLGGGVEAAPGGFICETLGVGLEEVGLEGGSVQWLIMVEFVFEASLTEARGVGGSAKSICTS